MTAVEMPNGLVEDAWWWPVMGGWLNVRVAAPREQARDAEAAAARTARRVARWASRLTRFDERSSLSNLNARADEPATRVRPTLAGVLDWAERATDECEGAVDVTLLDERLAAENGASASPGLGEARPAMAGRAWWLERSARGAVVHRGRRVRFDLDGVAKGWIADRAAAMLARFPAALVDADGDISVRTCAGLDWRIGVADPRAPDAPDLVELRLDAGERRVLGVATSGTSVHAWGRGRSRRHHLIDPRTGVPAVTDVIQATVLTTSARRAEVLAKSIVIDGSQEGFARADAAGVEAAIALLDSGELLATAGTVEWLA